MMKFGPVLLLLELKKKILKEDLETYLPQYQRRQKIDEPEHPLLQHFSVVVPVYHKEYAIAYAFLGSDGLGDLDSQGYDPISSNFSNYQYYCSSHRK